MRGVAMALYLPPPEHIQHLTDRRPVRRPKPKR